MTDGPVDPGTALEPTPPGGGHLDADDEVIEAELVDDDGAGETSKGDAASAATVSRGTLSKGARTIMWIAGAIVAVLLLIALYLIGARLSTATVLMPTPTPTPTATPTPTPIALPVGPVEEGTHRWDELLGGECLDPFDTAWQEEYTVVSCATPHPAQLVLRGVFADAPETEYPGLEQLGARMNLLCTAPSVVDYSVAGGFSDIQVEASFAVDAAQWDAGNRTYFCFLSRSSGEPFSASIALPQPAPAG